MMEGIYCADTTYEDRFNKKERQHLMPQTTLGDHGCKVSTLLVILGIAESHCHATAQGLNSYVSVMTLDRRYSSNYITRLLHACLT